MTFVLPLTQIRPTGGSNFVGAGRYKPDQLTETVSFFRTQFDFI